MTATTASASPRPDTAIRHRAVFFVLGAAVLFAVCNVAWRYGGGSTLAVVALRAGLGALVGWAITRRAGRPRWTSALRSRSGRVAVVAKVAREHRLCDEGASCGSGGDPSSRAVAS